MSQPLPPQPPQQERYQPFRRRETPRTSPRASTQAEASRPTASSTTTSSSTASTAQSNAPKRTRLSREARRNPPKLKNIDNDDNDSSDDTSVNRGDNYEWVEPLIPIVVFSPFVMLFYGALLFTLLGIKAWMAGIPMDSVFLFL